MDWKHSFAVGCFILFLLCLVIIGTNVAAKQLAAITNWEIAPPFMFTGTTNNVVRLDFLGESYQYSVVPVQNSYTFFKSSIQNSLVTVKFNIAPRVDYLRYQWDTGLEKLVRDLTNLVHN